MFQYNSVYENSNRILRKSKDIKGRDTISNILTDRFESAIKNPHNPKKPVPFFENNSAYSLSD